MGGYGLMGLISGLVGNVVRARRQEHAQEEQELGQRANFMSAIIGSQDPRLQPFKAQAATDLNEALSGHVKGKEARQLIEDMSGIINQTLPILQIRNQMGGQPQAPNATPTNRTPLPPDLLSTLAQPQRSQQQQQPQGGAGRGILRTLAGIGTGVEQALTGAPRQLNAPKLSPGAQQVIEEEKARLEEPLAQLKAASAGRAKGTEMGAEAQQIAAQFQNPQFRAQLVARGLSEEDIKTMERDAMLKAMGVPTTAQVHWVPSAVSGKDPRVQKALDLTGEVADPNASYRLSQDGTQALLVTPRAEAPLTGEAKQYRWALDVLAHPKDHSPEDNQTAEAIKKKWEQESTGRGLTIETKQQQTQKLPQETARFWAEAYIQGGGVMPSSASRLLGRGAMQQIMSEIPTIAKERGLTVGQMMAAQADVAALRKALTTMQNSYAQVSTFEKTAQQNLDRAVDAAGKIADTGSPWFNKPFREAQKGLEGSPELAVYEAARTVAFTEVSRVLSGAMGNGALSDNARDEANDVLNKDYSLQQLLGVAELLKKDMASRTSNMRETIGGIKDQIATPAGGGTPGAPRAPGAAPGKPVNPKDPMDIRGK